MKWIKQKISALQNRPYAERVKILKISVVIVFFLILLIWFLTLHLRNTPGSDGFSKFAPLLDNIRKFKDIKSN